MKKLSPYTGKSYNFFIEVLKNKRKKSKNLITESVKATIKSAYEQYVRFYDTKSLPNLVAKTFDQAIKDQLEGLYSYRSKKLDELRGKILRENSFYGCPCCTIVSESNTLDHIVPKSEFQEFAVHPLNLIPCCSRCNGKKGVKWREDGKLTLLNLYQDDIPNDRFLFVTLSVEEGKPRANFRLIRPANIDTDLYSRIEAHYKLLELCERFNEGAILHFDAINSDLLSLNNRGYDNLVDFLRKKAQTILSKHGNNNWVGVLYEACSQNREIIENLRQP